MNFYLLNSDLKIIDVIDDYESYIWTNRFCLPGDFEMVLPANEKYLSNVQKDCILIREGQPTNGMIIYNKQILTDAEEGDTIIIKGFCLKALLDRRIVWNQTNLNSKLEYAMRRLVDENAINPTNIDRVIPNLILGELKEYEETVSAQFTGTNLGEALTKLCQFAGFGYDVLLDLEKKKLVFTVNKGTDRSHLQNENPYVIFSEDYDNLLSSSYELNTENYKNVAKVAGEGEGTARKSVDIGNASGLSRYETFVDARDISSNDGEITEEEYNHLLTQRGNEAIAELITEENISGEIEKDYNYIFGVDYFIGDTVSLINKHGIEMTPQIVEVTESDEAGSFDTIVKFES